MRAHQALALLLVSLASCGLIGLERVTREEALAYSPSAAIHRLVIEGFNGDIQVVPVESAGPLKGRSRLYASARSADLALELLGQLRWRWSEEGGVLTLSLTRPEDGANNVGASIGALEVPHIWALDLRSSNGDVKVSPGFQASVEARTSNGSLDLCGATFVEGRTSNGGVRLTGSPADFYLKTSNGSVGVSLEGDWDGRGIAHSSNGGVSVHCSGRLDCALKAKTSNGKVRVFGEALGDAGTGHLALYTTNGNISVTHGQGSER